MSVGLFADSKLLLPAVIMRVEAERYEHRIKDMDGAKHLHRFVWRSQRDKQGATGMSHLRQYFSLGSPPFPLESSVIKTRTLSKSASPRT